MCFNALFIAQITKNGKVGKVGKVKIGACKNQFGCRKISTVSTAQEQNLAQVGGDYNEPAQVSPDQVIGWIGQGFSVVSGFLGPIIAQDVQAGQAAGPLEVSDGQDTIVVEIAPTPVPWIPIAIGAGALLLLVGLASR